MGLYLAPFSGALPDIEDVWHTAQSASGGNACRVPQRMQERKLWLRRWTRLSTSCRPWANPGCLVDCATGTCLCSLHTRGLSRLGGALTGASAWQSRCHGHSGEGSVLSVKCCRRTKNKEWCFLCMWR